MYTSIHRVTGKTKFSFPILLFWPFQWGELHFSANGESLRVGFSNTETIGSFRLDHSTSLGNPQDKSFRLSSTSRLTKPVLLSAQERCFDSYIRMLISGRILKSFNAHMNGLMKTKIELEKQRIKVQAEVEKFTI